MRAGLDAVGICAQVLRPYRFGLLMIANSRDDRPSVLRCKIRARRLRAYLLAVTVVATALIGLILVRPQTDSTPPMRAEIHVPRTTERETATDVQQRLTDPEFLRQTIFDVSREHADMEAECASLVREGLQVEVTPIQGSGQWKVDITCTDHHGGAHGGHAAGLINRLAQRHVEQWQPPVNSHQRQELIAAEAALQGTQQRRDEAVAALDQFANQSRQPGTEQSATAEISLDPRRQELTRKIDELLVRQQSLPARMTALHPEMIKLDDQLVLLEQRLRSLTPKSADGVINGAIAENHTLRESSSHDNPLFPAQLEQLESDRTAAEQDLVAAHQRFFVAKQAVSVPHSMQPPRVIELARAPAAPLAPSRWPLMGLIGVVAMVVGSATAISGVRYDPTLRSSADVQASLGLPVVGTMRDLLSGEPEPPIASPPSWTHKVRRGSEALLGVMVLVIVLLAVVDPGFAGRCLADPLATTGHVVSGVAAMFGR